MEISVKTQSLRTTGIDRSGTESQYQRILSTVQTIATPVFPQTMSINCS
jgi:hypothetical protein